MDNSQSSTQSSTLKRAYLALEEMEARLTALQRRQTEPIAIVGMACRFPGGVDSPEAYWKLLNEGVDAIIEVPSTRWSIDEYYNADPTVPGKMSTRCGGFLRDPIDTFDPQFFGISPREVNSMDPQQRLLLEVSWEALENAGQAPLQLNGSRTGVFIGATSFDYAYLFVKSNEPNLLDGYYASGIAHSVISGRLSYILGLNGPSITVDTACSSSLTAIHLACQSLRNGETSMALAGGVNLILSPENYIAFSKFSMLSPDGHCKTFDDAADGFSRGEGCGIIVLKRLSDAQAHGDRILAVIRGSAVSQDGASSGLTVPNGPSQEGVIRGALENAGVDPSAVGYVEAHGTGTSLGDPIEVRALGNVFSKNHSAANPLWIGSVKTNIGHLEASAGAAGLMKVVLGLQHGIIPPNLHFNTPSHFISWGDLPFSVPQKAVSWPVYNGVKALGGVSAFGFSGTNVHIVLEEAPSETQPSGMGKEGKATSQALHLLTLSAKTDKALKALAERFSATLVDTPEELENICFTANTGRSHFSQRLTVPAETVTEMVEKLTAFTAGQLAAGVTRGEIPGGDAPRVGFLFTGQGSQYAGMAQGLYRSEPVFRAVLEKCANFLSPYLDKPLLSIIFAETEEDRALLDHTSYTQPAIFSIQVALVELWKSWGVHPAAVLGHSVGAYAAAYTAGIFSLEDGLKLITARGKLMGALPAGGSMAAVFADEATVRSAIAPFQQSLSIATLNTPENTVISGDDADVQAAINILQARKIQSRQLNVSHAFHSKRVEPILDRLEHAASEVKFSAPNILFVSDTTGKPALGDEATNAIYWRKHTREAVRFADGMDTLEQQGISIFLEIGPSGTLIAMGQRCLSGKEKQPIWLASLRANTDNCQQILSALSALYVNGVSVDWEKFEGSAGSTAKRRVSLPTYPFQRTRHWLTKKDAAKAPRMERTEGGQIHPLLGRRLRSAMKGAIFEFRLNCEGFSFLNDHRILGMPMLPAAAFMEAALAMGVELLHSQDVAVRDLTLFDALTIGEDESRVVQLIAAPAAEDVYHFEFYSQGDQETEWKMHAAGDILRGHPAPAAFDLMKIATACIEELSAEGHVSQLREHGMEFGPSLMGVEKIRRRDGEALGQISLTKSVMEERGDYLIHPALLDAHLQVLASALGKVDGTYLPFNIGNYQVYLKNETPVWSYVLMKEGHASNGNVQTVTGSVFLLGQKGDVVAEIQDIHLKLTSQNDLLRLSQSRLEDWLYEMDWDAAPLLPGTISTGSQQKLWSLELISAQLPDTADKFGDLPEIQEYGLQILPVLEQCSVDFIILAFVELGWCPQIGQKLTTLEFSSQLHITPRHFDLFNRLLAILEEEKIIKQQGGEWHIISLPDPQTPETRLAALLEAHPASQAEVHLTQRCGHNLAGALKGDIDPLQLLFPGGDMSDAEALYQNSLTASAYNSLLGDLVQFAIEQVPAGQPLLVLEVGAGTGGTSAFVLPKLPSERIDYLFSDVSPLFLSRAQNKFAAYPFMRFGVVDVEKNLDEQGLAGQTFDMVIAANIIHATSDLKNSLSNLRRALSTGGLMVLLEVTAPQRWIDITFGLTEGWWNFTDRDLRRTYPLLNQAEWLELFKDSGFVDAAAFPRGDCPVEQAVFIAQNGQKPSMTGSWIVFEDERASGARFIDQTRLNGEHCLSVRVGDSIEINGDDWIINPVREEEIQKLLKAASPCRGIVHLWSLDIPEMDEINSVMQLEQSQLPGCESVLHLLHVIAGQEKTDLTPMWLVTRGAQTVEMENPNPAQALLWGFARTIVLELPELNCKMVDLGKEADAADVLWAEIHQPDPENQIVWRNGVRYAARLKRSRKAISASIPLAQPVSLQISQRGSFDRISFQPAVRRRPGPGEVEIQVQAVGLNFKDVLNALGMYPGDPGPLGGECAGVVSAVGSGVDSLRVGEAVIALASGAFASFVTTPVELVLPRPGDFSAEEAASIPIPFITAWFTLYHLANLSQGQRVLIHAGAGGVGLAAIQLAQRAGAEIFTTAGSAEKRAYLRRLGVQHVMDSRSLDFADKIMSLTNGRGVDVVLNSLAGDFIAKSLEVLAPNGCFLEIGKAGILSLEEISQLKDGRTYHVIDWGETAIQDPELIRSMFIKIIGEFGTGQLHLLPRRVFNADEIVPAFRYMAQARHTGKIVVRMPFEGQKLELRSNASYLISGGLGGLGLLTAEWLAQQGALSLVLVGRNSPSEEALLKIRQIEKNGVQVSIQSGDVSKEADVQRIMAEIEAHLPPLRGIIHSAGVLADGILIQQDWSHFSKVLAPKVSGSWNLHHLTKHLPLDFFVMYSSIASVFGSPGQANHSTANAFMDGLAHYRCRQGLAATSVNWGVWSQVGIAAEQHVENRAALQKIGIISPRDGLTLLEKFLSSNPEQIVVSPIYWPTFLRTFSGGRKPPFLKNIVEEQEAKEASRPIVIAVVKKSNLSEQLKGASPAKQRASLLAYVRQQVARILSLEDEQLILDHKPFNEMGLDSLMAVELRNLLSEGLELKQSLPATLVFNYPTVADISDYLAHDVFAHDGENAAEKDPLVVEKADGNTLSSVLDDMDELSDDEINRILAQKMNRKSE